MEADMIVRGGKAVLEGGGLVDCDIAVEGGRIAGLVAPGASIDARQTVDANGSRSSSAASSN